MRGPMDPAASAPDTLHMAALLASAFGERQRQVRRSSGGLPCI